MACPHAFASPKCTSGDRPVPPSDFASHNVTSEGKGTPGLEWMEAALDEGAGGPMWYVHTNFYGANSTTSEDMVTVTTHSDPSYPQGVATYNTVTYLLTFTVASTPGCGPWSCGLKAGDEIQCYPFSTEAIWPVGSSWFWDGNCRLNGGPIEAGHFVHSWPCTNPSGCSGPSGEKNISCMPNANQGLFGLITTGQAVQVFDIGCPSGTYQAGGILWFDTGAFEDIGSSYGDAALTYKALNPPACTSIQLTIPTSRGDLSGTIGYDPFYYFLGASQGNGCPGEASSPSGSLSLNGQSYQVLGVFSQFRCENIGTSC